MWVILKRKHFCGFDSLFCGHCLGRNVSHFGLLHLYWKKVVVGRLVGDTEGFSDGYKLAGGPQLEPCQPTGTPGLPATSCVGERDLPQGLALAAIPFHPLTARTWAKGEESVPPLTSHARRNPWEHTLADPTLHLGQAGSLPCKPGCQELVGWAGDRRNQPVHSSEMNTSGLTDIYTLLKVDTYVHLHSMSVLPPLRTGPQTGLLQSTFSQKHWPLTRMGRLVVPQPKWKYSSASL